jgi:hypothetical protein
MKFLNALIASPALHIILGAIFLLIAITGGGITSSWLALPSISALPRVIAGVVGLGMILFGLYLINAATRPASGHSDDGTPEVAGLESLDCSLPYKSVYSLDGLGKYQECTVEFRNDTPQTMKVYWVNEDGGTQFFFNVAPYQSYVQATHVGNVWLVRDDADRSVAMFRCVLPRAVIRRPAAKSVGGA